MSDRSKELRPPTEEEEQLDFAIYLTLIGELGREQFQAYLTARLEREQTQIREEEDPLTRGSEQQDVATALSLSPSDRQKCYVVYSPAEADT
jgi:hypothetical protein